MVRFLGLYRAEHHPTRIWAHLPWETKWGWAGSVFGGTHFRWKPRESQEGTTIAHSEQGPPVMRTFQLKIRATIGLLSSHKNHLIENKFPFYMIIKQKKHQLNCIERRFIHSALWCEWHRQSKQMEIRFFFQINNFSGMWYGQNSFSLFSVCIILWMGSWFS